MKKKYRKTKKERMQKKMKSLVECFSLPISRYFPTGTVSPIDKGIIILYYVDYNNVWHSKTLYDKYE